MDKNGLRDLLNGYKDGSVSLDEAMESLKKLPYEDLGFAMIDHHRALRSGFPEVIFAPGKTNEQIIKIALGLLSRNTTGLLISRAEPHVFEAVRPLIPAAVYHEVARTIEVKRTDLPRIPELPICIASAGTSDMPVAEEAAVTAEAMGNRVERVYDVGVAGIHRLFARLDTIERAGVVIAVAGMEGALASVIGGLVSVPVIAVPTSIGYGSSFGGLSALLTMLNSCASGIGVVNIDNGFGAAVLASRINRLGLD